MENPIAEENKMYVVFYSDAIEHGYESEQAGRPIYHDVPFVKIMVPGDKHTVIERVANDDDKRKYPNAWRRFQAGEKEGVDGMPLEQWAQIKRSQVKEAKYYECHTVEALASLSDANCQSMGMGFLELRNKAKAYLNIAADTAAATAQAAENERLRADMAEMREQMKVMQESVSRGPGRPKRETAEA